MREEIIIVDISEVRKKWPYRGMHSPPPSFEDEVDLTRIGIPRAQIMKADYVILEDAVNQRYRYLKNRYDGYIGIINGLG